MTGFLERVFQDYDYIRNHRPSRLEPLAPASTPASLKPASTPASLKPDDPPPWVEPPKEDPPRVADQYSGITAAEHAEGVLKKNLGYDPAKSWRDIDADSAEAAQKRIEERLANPSGASFKQDEAGLANAYNDRTATGVYYDPNTRTEYVKGSVTGRDWYDDVTKVPFGSTRDSERYQQADKAYDDLLAKGKVVDRIVGHSLGGSVALDMQKNHGIPQSRTFGAPVLDANPFGHSERYRHPLDPVSVLDRGATWGPFNLSTHSYAGFGGLQM